MSGKRQRAVTPVEMIEATVQREEWELQEKDLTREQLFHRADRGLKALRDHISGDMASDRTPSWCLKIYPLYLADHMHSPPCIPENGAKPESIPTIRQVLHNGFDGGSWNLRTFSTCSMVSQEPAVFFVSHPHVTGDSMTEANMRALAYLGFKIEYSLITPNSPMMAHIDLVNEEMDALNRAVRAKPGRPTVESMREAYKLKGVIAKLRDMLNGIEDMYGIQ